MDEQPHQQGKGQSRFSGTSDKKRRASKLISLRTIIASVVTVGILTATVLARGTEQHDARAGAKPESAAKERLITAEAAVGKKVGSYTLIDQDGKQFQLADFGGKPYMINFVYLFQIYNHCMIILYHYIHKY